MKNKNPKSPLTDSNSELRTKPQSQLMRQDAPHYYEVKIPNHPNGVPQMHCGKLRDAESLLEKYPDATMTKIYLPHPPQTVDVPHVSIAPDPELPTRDIVVNMDGGVGGSWEEVEYVEIKGQKLELQQSELPIADYDS